jgi:hypothetical protein
MAEQSNLPKNDTHITKEEVSKGFRRWRETTSTSPSGCHLGLQRITTTVCDEPILEDIQNDILQAQTDVINLPIRNGFSPQRCSKCNVREDNWKTHAKQVVHHPHL